MHWDRRLALALAAALLAAGSCSTTKEEQPPALAWRDTPKEVLLADLAHTFEYPRAAGKEARLPRERRLFDGASAGDLRIYRYAPQGLQPVAFSLQKDRLRGDFRGGERYLVHRNLTPWVVSKYQLFCRIRALSLRLGGLQGSFVEPLCLRILCPDGPYFADKLLDEFPLLQQHQDLFPRSELRNLELGPLPDDLRTGRPAAPGFGNLCDQCLGRDFGVVLVPDCVGVVVQPAAPRWEPRGPAPNTFGQVENIADRQVVGAVNAVAPHPSDPDVLLVGGANGGIWRTDDATAVSPRWTPQLDGGESLSIGALEFDPTDASASTLVAGIGRFSSLGRIGGARSGILRTTDGGTTWAPLDGGGALRGLNVSGVAPRGAVIVLSADDADGFGNAGIWRSADTGSSWTRVSGAPGSGLPAGAACDLAADRGDPARLYTHAGSAGLFRSTDTGATWTNVGSPQLNAAIAGADNVELAVGAAGNVFVAVVTAGRLSHLFRSPDGATGWTALDLPRTIENGAAIGIHPGGQGRIHLSLAAEPSDPDVVYVGGDRQPCFTETAGCTGAAFPNSLGAVDFTGRLFRVDAALPSGSQAASLTHSGTAANSAPHADSRDMDVAANGVLVQGDDGGVYRRTAPLGATGDWFSMNGDLQTTEFHDIAWDSLSDVIVGGAQDTGTPRQRATLDGTWRSVSTGDGGSVAVDDASSPTFSTRYSSFQRLIRLRRQVFDASNTFQSEVLLPLVPLGGAPQVLGQFYTPLALNNVDATRLVLGAANGVYESFDQGDTVARISTRVANDGFGADPIAYGAAGNADVLYVGSGSQVLVRSAAPPAALAPAAAYPGGAVLDVAVDPADPLSAFVIDAGDVHWTRDGGASWTTITGNLGTLGPGALRSLEYRSGASPGPVVGTDTYVFTAPGPGHSTWSRLGVGLPGAPVFDLDYDATDRILVAGTLGRGAWVLHE